MKNALTLILFFIVTSFQSDTFTASNEEIRLWKLINVYRKENNLPQIPLSAKLTKVAKIHCKDLYDNFLIGTSVCNEHSWSDKGNWKAVCYTPDHAQKEEMWKKPLEIAGYESYGFEIEHNHFPKDDLCNAQCAINGWKGSLSHNNIMINKENWKDIKFKAMGVGMYKGYACVWFGELEDK